MLPPVPVVVRTFQEAGKRLTLRNFGTHYELMIGQVPILTSKALGTERAFGELVRTEGLGASPRVLLGGLGFGASLVALLGATGPNARVIIVEKLSTVVELLRTDLAHLAPGVLKDPRVRLVQDDVADVIARERDLDAILLDVDNGPDWASFRSNSRLYSLPGLAEAKRALRPGGLYSVWSGYAADGFLKQLRRAGFEARIVRLRERGAVRARAYVGQNPGGAAPRAQDPAGVKARGGNARIDPEGAAPRPYPRRAITRP
jgi:predicted membrane-bound spermidine synthase